MGIDGTWTNELQSTLMINPVQNGEFAGTYTTAVSGDACAKGEFVVLGRTDTDSGGRSVAWSVCWKNDSSSCASVTAWAGQYDAQDDVIVAFWLLSRQTDPSEDWSSTNVGVDTFVRSGAERSPLPRAVVARSHP